MIRKYVCYIDVNSDTGEVSIEGLENAYLIDKVNIVTELINQYERQFRNYENVKCNV